MALVQIYDWIYVDSGEVVTTDTLERAPGRAGATDRRSPLTRLSGTLRTRAPVPQGRESTFT